MLVIVMANLLFVQFVLIQLREAGIHIHTVEPRNPDPIYIANYYLQCVKVSWTYCNYKSLHKEVEAITFQSRQIIYPD